MNDRPYQICKKCVMDTSDSKITFDNDGVCDWCNDYEQNILPQWKNSKNSETLANLAKYIKKKSKNKRYDCIIGLSGGIDSSYLCYLAKEVMGLNPLVIIVDTGWNLNVANTNIEKLVKGLDLDFKKIVVDWNEMKDLQLAFLESSVPYQDLPQDMAIFATIYNYAVKYKIKCVLTGANNTTECIRPPMEWVYINDKRFIKDVHNKFGKNKLKSFPLCSMFKYKIIYPIFYGMRRFYPLNLIDYNYENAKKFLNERFGWEAYENKHYENIFTRWYEGYYLPTKFGYDKRRSYFSNMILTGQMTRDDALDQLKKLGYSEDEIIHDSAYIADKLCITTAKLDELVKRENKTFKDYKNSYSFINFSIKLFRALGLEVKQIR